MMAAKWRYILASGALLVGVVLALALDAMLTGGEQSPQAAPQRIICMSPAVVEIAFALGAGDRVVGVSQFATYPPEAAALPKCGGINPALETILALDPDLIVTQGESEKLAAFSRDHSIRLELLPLTDLESILTETEHLGRIVGREEAGREVAAAMRRRLDAVREKARGAERPTVMLVTSREQGVLGDIWTTGPHSFLSDAVEVAGGHNAFDDLPKEYAIVNREALLAKKPDVIIELLGEGGEEAELTRQAREVWGAMPLLPAVRDGRVYAVSQTYALVPGPRVVDLIEHIAEILHGEAAE